MRRIVTILVLASTVTACKQSGEISISGTAPGMEDGTALYLLKVNDNNQNQVIDTAHIKNEGFSFEFQRGETPEILLVNPENVNGQVLLFPEDKQIEIKLYKDSIFNSEVTGGRENALMMDYYSRYREINNRKNALQQAHTTALRNRNNEEAIRIRTELIAATTEETSYRKEFVTENDNSLFGLVILSEMLGTNMINADETESLTDGLDPELKETPIYKKVAQTLGAARQREARQQAISRGAINTGQEAPDFSGPTPDGDELALSDAMGKVTLIDFWASWCRPCRIENPNVVRTYNQYKDKGLNIISISLDRSEARWLKAIEDDQMDWYHISNLQHWNDPIARQYGVRSIPQTFLLDEDGVVVAKNLRGPALGQKIGELLN